MGFNSGFKELMIFHGKYGDFQHSLFYCFVCEYIHRRENMLHQYRNLEMHS